MKVSVLQTGSTLVSSAVPDRSSHRWSWAYTGLFQKRNKRISVPVKAFLVETNGHRVLIDTGWSAECATHAVRHLGFGLWFASEPVMEADQAVPAQLKELGLRPEDLDAVILTHLDCDHVSGLVPLAGARKVYCSEPEWLHACTKNDVRYRTSLWRGVPVETIAMSDDPQAPFGKSCDVFGDGSIKAVLTPGHSEGSMAVIAYGANGYAAFVGDDSYNRHSWEGLKLPGPVFDVEAMRRTLLWVRSLSEDERCVALYAAHDPEGPSEFSDVR